VLDEATLQTASGSCSKHVLRLPRKAPSAIIDSCIQWVTLSFDLAFHPANR